MQVNFLNIIVRINSPKNLSFVSNLVVYGPDAVRLKKNGFCEPPFSKTVLWWSVDAGFLPLMSQEVLRYCSEARCAENLMTTLLQIYCWEYPWNTVETWNPVNSWSKLWRELLFWLSCTCRSCAIFCISMNRRQKWRKMYSDFQSHGNQKLLFSIYRKVAVSVYLQLEYSMDWNGQKRLYTVGNVHQYFLFLLCWLCSC